MPTQPLRFSMIALMTLVVFASSGALAAEPKRGGTLRVSYGNEIANLDFHTAPGYEMMWVAMTLNTLFSVFVISSRVSGFDGP